MSNITIYHNPKCSKSRETLELITNKNLNPKIILYLEKKLSKQELRNLVSKLGISPRELLRKGESEYKENVLSNPDLGNEELIDLMIRFPQMIERPIVVKDNKAIIGRPPKNILKLI